MSLHTPVLAAPRALKAQLGRAIQMTPEPMTKEELDDLRSEFPRGVAMLHAPLGIAGSHTDMVNADIVRRLLATVQCLESALAESKAEQKRWEGLAESSWQAMDRAGHRSLVDCLARLEAERELAEAREKARTPWQNMATAPRDGTVFLAVNMRGNATNRFELCFSAPCPEPQHWAPDAGWRNPGRDWSTYPTHWMPLPELPSPKPTPSETV